MLVDLSGAPRVHVVIPCYSVADYVRDAVLSVVGQDFTQWRATIVDDGSPDNILEAISDLTVLDKRIRYVRKENGGVASARNFGVQYSNCMADYVLFLDGDDMLKPGALTKMVGYMDKHKSVGFVHCDVEAIDQSGKPARRDLEVKRWAFGLRDLDPLEPLTPFESIYTLSFIIPSLCLLRRQVFEQTSGYDEDFGHNMEDTDLHLRMALLAPVHFLPEKLVSYRIRLGQASANNEVLSRQAKKLWKKWSTNDSLTNEQKELVKRAEVFRTKDLVILNGFAEARKYFVNNHWYKAFRFWFGAMRRLIGVRSFTE